MAYGGSRPVAPARRVLAGVLGTVGAFIVLFGAGAASWAMFALGLALVVLAVSLLVLPALGGSSRIWVEGTCHVVSASEPPANSAFGRCELQIVIDAPGVAPAAIKIRDPRVPVAKWPDAGATLPVVVAVDDPRRVRIQWDDVRTHGEVAEEEAAEDEALAAGYHYPAETPIDLTATGLDDIAPPPREDPPTDDDDLAYTTPPQGTPVDLPPEHPAYRPPPPDDLTDTADQADPAVDDDDDRGDGGTGWSDDDPHAVPRPRRPSPRPHATRDDEPVAGVQPLRNPGPVTLDKPQPDGFDDAADHPGGHPVATATMATAMGMAGTATALADPPVARPTDDAGFDDLTTAYPSAHAAPTGPIHGVGITVLVHDLDRSVGFYRDTLGFHVIDRGARNAVLASGDTRLVLRMVASVAPVNRRVVHINLEVGDITAAYTELQAKGVRFTYGPRPVNRGDKLELWAAAFSDPDGHGIALTQWRSRP